ncbi:hypothetical protein EXIGLDRAFT_664412 [Exidia glandulosa HHB12029]|uniref:Calcium-channel protein CCH1 n=1 Tax=Exidia glandulosa HHB12029 TaxID=1314781 RepID=A0A165Q943_EXIGL|nr:hypothetical protein EXIGLDRAFT_664412 [Exidia glandulosa HHB12029]
MQASSSSSSVASRPGSRAGSPSPSPVAGGLSRRYSWNRTADPFTPERQLDDPLASNASLVPHVPARLNEPAPFPAHEAGSRASLDSPSYQSTDDQEDERLTSYEHDPEASPRSPGRRRTDRFNQESALKKSSATLRVVSKNIRRMSVRVVNLAGLGVENQHRIRLPDDPLDGLPQPTNAAAKLAAQVLAEEHDDEPEQPFADAATLPKLRGRTLGVFSARSRIRKAMYNLLLWSWTEPLILLLIFANAVMLSLQARHALFPSEDGTSPPVKGYFHDWEDTALFALFIIFTLELFARIVVSGLILDPDVHTKTLFSHLFTAFNPPTAPIAQQGMPPSSLNDSTLSRGGSLRDQTLNRSNSMRDGKVGVPKMDIVSRFNRSVAHVAAPFALAHEVEAEARAAKSHMRQVSGPGHAASSSMSAHGSSHLPRQASHATTMSTSSVSSFWHPVHGPINTPSELYGGSTIKPQYKTLPFALSIARSHSLAHRGLPYLRHSWNRIDFLAVLSFWITFVLSVYGIERAQGVHISIFRALSVLRCARLLAVTQGTTTIMHSLKIARPMLANVAYFVLFAIILFSVVGVQAFRGSLRRTCVLISTTPGVPDIELDQVCGGYIEPLSLNRTGYISREGIPIDSHRKGYTCPLGQVCRERGSDPHVNLEAFDDIVLAALQVMIIAGANGWSPVMFAAIDGEYFISSLFFIVCLVILNFWLINLFVAVITNTFAAIRAQTKKSAFGADIHSGLLPDPSELAEDWVAPEVKKQPRGMSSVRRWYLRTRYFWVALITAGVSVQALRTPTTSPDTVKWMNLFEIGITFAFDFEILWRFAGYLPDWRTFFVRQPGNIIDLLLAVGSTVIQTPVIKHSPVYPWLTLFQLARFYRVILDVPRMRPLLLSVFGNFSGLVNMCLFLLLTNFIAALFALQIFRGDIGDDAFMNFSQLWNGFLAMYQVLSSENWTDVLYTASEAETGYKQAVIAALFVTGWFFFANFILVQLFIAVINENFEVAEEIKHSRQYDRFRANAAPTAARVVWLDKLNPYRYFKANPESITVQSLPPNLVLPIQRSLVQNLSNAPGGPGAFDRRNQMDQNDGGSWIKRKLKSLQAIFVGDEYSDEVPMKTIRKRRQRESMVTEAQDENEKHLEILAAAVTADAAREEESANDTLFEQRAQKADFINAHPSYDKALWVLPQSNRLRQLCQKFVMPSGGERVYGKPPSAVLDMAFRLVLLLSVVGGITVAGIATPIYRRDYYRVNGVHRFAWFDTADAAFGLVLVLEFVVKIIADGFVFAPNAYLLSLWNGIDFFILLTVLANISTNISTAGGTSRFTRALKAFRALKLITLIQKLRETFQSLIFAGAMRILDAAMLAVLYMIPYAIWGLNIFSGKLFGCNDEGAAGRSECVNEFFTTALDDSSYPYLVPRVWDNPSEATEWSFDTFRSSILILFEIVSLEGWIDVMRAALAITGPDQQPRDSATQVNAIFFLFYILLGALIILTLFVSIIIGNFSTRSGMALLTKEQREWIDLQKLIKRQKPSKRPERPATGFRRWCYERAVNKHGFWSRTMTVIFIAHIGALMSLNYTVSTRGDLVRDIFFLAVIIAYAVDLVVRFFGLGYASFRANGWNLFDCVVVAGSLIATTFTIIADSHFFWVQQAQKLFLVSIAFKLVQKSNSLNQLFKTSIGSLPALSKLVMLWFCLFLFFGILFVEVFGLTRWGSAESRNENYSSLGRALVMMAFMSTGEGWNEYMHNFAVEYPRCTNSSQDLPDSDCGSAGWAFTLFISWNILSMYIFVNMFTGVVVENFSYVFQISSGTKSLNREEMRAFKKVWTEFANKNGYLPRQKLAAFFGKLSGVFEVRIYPPENQIKTLLAAARETDEDRFSERRDFIRHGVNITRLTALLADIDQRAVKSKRNLYCRVYHEASLIDKKEGLDFTRMLMMLAHHKLVDDDRALELKDLLARKAVMAEVMDHVRLDKVRSLLRTIYHRRRFNKIQKDKKEKEEVERSLATEGAAVPGIVVEAPWNDTPEPHRPTTAQHVHGPRKSRDITQGDSPNATPRQSGSNYLMSTRPPSNGGDESRRNSTASTNSGHTLSPSASPRSSMMSQSNDLMDMDASEMLSAMNASLWGEMMQHAAQEEEE